MISIQRCIWCNLCEVGAEFAAPGWNRVKVSESLDATTVALVSPAVTILVFIIIFSNAYSCILHTWTEHGQALFATVLRSRLQQYSSRIPIEMLTTIVLSFECSESNMNFL